MWKWIGWQLQRRTCYRVQYHNVAWCSIYEWTIEHNKHLTLSSCAQQKYFSHDSWNVRFLACFDGDMFRSKYASRVRPWSFSMLCRWRHWGRGVYLLPLQQHTRDTSLSIWLPMPALEWMLQTTFSSQSTTVPVWRVKKEGAKTGLLSAISPPMTVKNESVTLKSLSMHIIYLGSDEQVLEGVDFFSGSVCLNMPIDYPTTLIQGGPPCPFMVKKVCMWSRLNSLSRQVVTL